MSESHRRKKTMDIDMGVEILVSKINFHIFEPRLTGYCVCVFVLLFCLHTCNISCSAL